MKNVQKNLIGKCQENWKYGNLDNMKDVNRNKRGSIVRGRQMQEPARVYNKGVRVPDEFGYIGYATSLGYSIYPSNA